MAEEHTGGMVALVPADPATLVVDGGDPPEQLHLTLAYLGDDVTAWTPEQRQAVLDAGAKIAANIGAPIEARAMGHTTFNPDGGDDGTKEPCAVYTIGDSDQIVPLQADVVTAITEAVPDLPPQHAPFLPHVTAGYQLDASALTYAGPVVFDRLRVALANDVTDYPLGSPEPSQEGAMAAAAPTVEAPEIAGDETDGEIPLRFPVLVLEGVETSDGRFLEAGSLSHRALPIPLLALPESAHGGNEPGAAGVVGRIDTLTRTPGPEVISPRTGEPFPEGTFVWSGTGALSSTARVGEYDVADMFRRRFLRGVSVDLAGMDYEVIGEGGLAADPEFPRRQMVAHSADIAAATLVCIAAFGDAYAEDATEPAVTEAAALDDIPEGLAASAFPAWRSAEVGDYPALVAAGAPVEITLPDDAADQLAAFIDDGTGEQRDAPTLAAAIVEFMAGAWTESPDDEATEDVAEDPAVDEGSMAAADTSGEDPVFDDVPTETGMPDEPQPCAMCDKPATHSLMSTAGDQFTPVCDDCDEAARAEIEAAGEQVGGVVAIGPADDPKQEDQA